MAGVIPASMTARIEDDFVVLWASRGAAMRANCCRRQVRRKKRADACANRLLVLQLLEAEA